MGPMEIVRLIRFVLGTLKVPIDLYKAHKKLGEEMQVGLENLMVDLDYLKSDLVFNKEGWTNYIELLLMELIYDIEDFAQSLWIPGSSGPFLSAIGMDPRDVYLIRIENFQDRIKKLEERQKKSSESNLEQGGASDPASSSAAEGYTPEESLVGISEPKKVLLDLLKKPASSSEQAGGQDAKVISIVGCPGVGKTALARAVYNHCVSSAVSRHLERVALIDDDHACASDEFECVAWVEAAGCNDKTALLDKILQQVQTDLLARRASLVPSQDNGNVASPDLHGILADKRYLVFIDDVQQAQVLQDIIHGHFPQSAKSGMVIVTTSVHQVVNVCSSGSYVHTMKCLDDTESKKLFCRLAFDKAPNKVSKALLAGSKSIITKCGGLPLALISVAKHMRINAGHVDRRYCVNLGKELGSHYLVGSKAEAQFRKLRRALEQCYEDLPNSDHKTYMLSLSIFPRNDPIKCKSLVRRLIAEGLVNVDGDGKECLDELVNRCIAEPVQISSCSQDLKSCRVNVGIMLEFIIHKSWSTNFVNVIREEENVCDPKGRIRRLSVQSSKTCEFQAFAQKNRMSETIRSLTIISSEGRSELSEIKSCKFLRLLDLEGCMGIDEAFFLGICELVYLKYLSLRRTDVKNIPLKIENLQSLQTLDVRETREIGLPIQAITLPELAFLFGKFVLPKMSNNTKEFLSTRSKLQTIAEIVVDQGNGSEHIILEAKNLLKVKVWCRDTRARPPASGSHPAPSASPSLQTSNNGFVLSLQSRFTSLDSLSIQSNYLSKDIMASLGEGPCKIDRMKLSGKLRSLPKVDALSMIDTLNKLQLSYTGLTSEELSVLQHISCLEYLKLQDNKKDSWGGSFCVLNDGFESLRRLCFQAPKLPKLEFHPESMKSLTSLHLLCPDISQMQDVKEINESIRYITSLNEVILHHSATKEIIEAWKTAARSNPNRPRVS